MHAVCRVLSCPAIIIVKPLASAYHTTVMCMQCLLRMRQCFGIHPLDAVSFCWENLGQLLQWVKGPLVWGPGLLTDCWLSITSSPYLEHWGTHCKSSELLCHSVALATCLLSDAVQAPQHANCFQEVGTWSRSLPNMGSSLPNMGTHFHFRPLECTQCVSVKAHLLRASIFRPHSYINLLWTDSQYFGSKHFI